MKPEKSKELSGKGAEERKRKTARDRERKKNI